MEIGAELYRGKAKTVYATDQPDLVLMRFRDDTSAFDGQKLAQLALKGETNNKINAFLMEQLVAAGVPTHFEKICSPTDSLVKRLNMIPVECVVRNVVAGSMARKLGIEEGTPLQRPVFELFYKSDALHDPMVNEDHVLALGWATEIELATMRQLTLRANQALQSLFKRAGIILVDYKLEFGRFQGAILLGDELTPDGCRLWDEKTQDKLDKDRFRRDLGGVVEAYRLVAQRIGVVL